jgi:hypothetical protein
MSMSHAAFVTDEPLNVEQLARALVTYSKALEVLKEADETVRQVAGSTASLDSPIMFVVESSVIWCSSPFIQCVAYTKKRARCKNEVFGEGQVWTWRGPFALLDDRWVGRLLSQTCRMHDDARADYGSPEWTRVSVGKSFIDMLPW